MGLRGICEKFRSEHLKMEDVPDVIKFADTNSSNYLIQACTDFLSDNSKDITNSVWRKLPSDITFKVFKVLSKKAKVEVSRCSSLLQKNLLKKIEISYRNPKLHLHLGSALPINKTDRLLKGIWAQTSRFVQMST